MPQLYRCPYCKTDWQIAADNPVSYGCPLKTCSGCRKVYLDPYCKEPALTPYQPMSKGKLFLGDFFGGVMLSFLAAGLVLVFSGSERAAGITLAAGLPVFWLLLFFHSLLTRKKVEQRRFALWQESDRRLKDQSYAVLLANLDYAVPRHYLPDNYRYSSEKARYQPAIVSGFRVS